MRQRSRTSVALWRVSPEGHRLRPVVRRLLAVHAAWAPDGRTIAFTGQFTVTGGNHLYVVPAEGGASRRIIAGEATEFSPTWSPDGSLLAFADFSGHVRVVRPDGTGDRALATLPNAEFFDLAWSPDGRWIAFAASKCVEET